MITEKSIDIVIPAYNCENTIIDVLDSIKAGYSQQKYVRNIVVVNDGSTDDTRNKIMIYKKTSILNIILVDKQNGGVSSARNEGVARTQGAEWIAFCDSDDLWLPEKLLKQIKVLDTDPTIDCLGGNYTSKPQRAFFRKINKLHKATVKEMLISNFPQPSTVMIKKKIFDEIGGFDEKQKYAEDGNFFLKVAASHNLYFLPEKLIEFGYGKRPFGEKGLSANLKGMYKGNIKNLKEMREMGYISISFYWQMRFFYFAKYIRRILLTRFANQLKN